VSHEFIRPDAPVILHDTASGNEYIPVSAMLEHARREGFTGSELELIRRMEAIGAHWMRASAVNPADPRDSITVDMFRLPASRTTG
jgi:hypothetical protein